MGAKGATILSVFAIMGVVLFLVQIARAESNQPSTDSSTAIDNRDLLQADATIMAGILILLTVSAIKDEVRLSWYSFIGLFPFAISAAFLIWGSAFVEPISGNEGVGNWVRGFSRIFAMIGLVMLAFILYVINKLIRYQKQKHEAEAQAFDTWHYSIPSSIRDKVLEKLGITTFTVSDAVRSGRTNYQELVKEAKRMMYD